MAISRGTWKECGLDTSPPRPTPKDRKRRLEMYVGRYVGRLNAAKERLPPREYDAFMAWVHDPKWLGDA